MCGIAAIIGKNSPGTVSQCLESMMKAQAHRGPDGEGVCVKSTSIGTVGLGHRRLAILDLSPLGHQPMENPDTGDVITYNGEIYNFPALRRELESAGYIFHGRSDTEILLRAYEEWGITFLDRLRGMFAFALWDAGRQKLLLARDHLGIKPLYYTSLAGNGFLCASEVRAIVASGLIKPEINKQALGGYLAYGSVQEPLTILKGLFLVEAGSWIQVEASGEVESKGIYWNIPYPETKWKGAGIQALVNEGRSLLEESVKRHLISDVPLGVFLSSGLDSTAVTGFAQRVAREQVHAFTVSFPDDPKLDESLVARKTAQRLGVSYHEYPVETTTALNWATQWLERLDQPVMDGFNTYLVSKAVHEQGIVVALSGQGADEILGGYPSFRRIPRWSRRLTWLSFLHPEIRANLMRLATLRHDGVVQKKSQDIVKAGPDILSIYFYYRRLMSDEDLEKLGFISSSLNLSNSFHLPVLETRKYVVSNDPIASVSRLESIFYLGNTLLRDGDVFGMANSLEIRVPFLDRDVVEWAFKLPGSVLLPEGADGKFLLRKMCAEFYSEEQLRQPKRGFSPPFSLWLLGPLREVMNECLVSLKDSELVCAQAVDHLRDLFLREPHTAAWSRLWSLVTLGYWLKKNGF